MNIEEVLKKIPDENTRVVVAQLYNLTITQQERINSLERFRFGCQSEKMRPAEPVLPKGSLFDEAEALAASTAISEDSEKPEIKPAEDDQENTSAPVRKQRAPKEFSEKLRRERVVHDLSPAQKACNCGCEMQLIGEEIVEKLAREPAVVYVKQHVYLKYACTGCKANVSQPEAEASPIKGGIFEPCLLAWLIAGKYSKGLPLYRLEDELKTLDVCVPRITLARNVIACAEFLKPIYNELRKFVLSCDVIGADETRLQVLKGKKPATSDNFMWLAGTHPWAEPAVFFMYDPHRSQAAAEKLLEGFKGKAIQVDGYSGYRPFFEKNINLLHMGCWSHARRKFEDAFKSGSKSGTSTAKVFLEIIGELFLMERNLKDLSAEERLRERNSLAPPILKSLREQIEKWLPIVMHSSKLGIALGYLSSQWEALQGFLKFGNLPLSNNGIENYVRPFAVGRRAWLFSASEAGAEASAILYSLAVTARAHELHTEEYFKYLLTHLPRVLKEEPDADLSLFLPWNVREALLAQLN